MHYTYITETFLSDNKHGKLVFIKQSKGCKITPEMHQNTISGRTPPGLAGGAYALPRPLSRMGVLTSKGWQEREWRGEVLLIREGREGKEGGREGPTYKGRERRGPTLNGDTKEGRDGKRGEGILPESR